jgi:hypothetical protein
MDSLTQRDKNMKLTSLTCPFLFLEKQGPALSHF